MADFHEDDDGDGPLDVAAPWYSTAKRLTAGSSAEILSWNCWLKQISC
jgi:hypothetical protein